ncbi:unnamed protein product, partial [Ectocarpus sp. 12 AP-2014]
RSSFDTNFGTPIVGRGRSGGGEQPPATAAAGGGGAPPAEQGRGNPSPGEVLTSAFKSAFTSSSSSSANPSAVGGVPPSPPPPPVGTFSGARVGSMRLGGGSIAGFAAQPWSAKQQQQQQQQQSGGGLGSRPQSLRTAPPSPLPPHQPGAPVSLED